MVAKLLEKKENSNTRKLRKMLRASGENQTHDLPSSSSDTPATELLELLWWVAIGWVKFQSTFPSIDP